MAPRVVRVRAMLTATALLAPLLLASHLAPLPSAEAAGSPSPSPAAAPAPHHHPPPLHQVRRPPQPQGHQRGGGARHPRPPAPTVRSPPAAWWRRLNLGERLGIALAGVAVAMQAALVAFLLALGARQRRRAAGKAQAGAEEEAAEAAAASRPAPA